MNLENGRELTGKVAIVTGAARNIGRAIALAFAEGGAAVMVNTRTSIAEAEAVAAEIEAAGGQALVCAADVTERQAVEGMVAETVARFGRIDILVNNAAVRREAPFLDIGFEEWREIVAIILDGAFLCAKACVPHMIEQGGGTIINIGGLTGHAGAKQRVHVIAAKAGVAGMTKALAHDLAEHGITANCVVPGMIDTVRGTSSAVDIVPAHRKTRAPLVGRLGRPEEVAAMVRHLCGPQSRYVTGQTIHVNGGIYLP
jgi:3-oxoacyl-[acyl-carrier protein] reductase